MPTVRFVVNGAPFHGECEERTLLVQVLRETLRLTGTHVGCDTSQCGCCTVLVDGAPAKACTLLAMQVDGSRIETIEGLAGDGDQPDALHPLQQAFIDCHGLQCGFCTPGMIMAAAALLRDTPRPTDDQIRHALEGNLCRCTGYVAIVDAVRLAAARIAGDPR
jgi:carbon-monoxide dehydrogenase small subunit